MTDQELVLRKLTHLLEHVARVRRRRSEDPAEFAADVDAQDAAALSLLVAIQDAIDLALHISADSGWGVPGSYGEGFELMASRGVLDLRLAGELVQLAAVRNRIAHGYASVDVRRLWAEVPAGLATLEAFAAAIASWLGRPPS